MLAKDSEGALVVLAPDDITFANEVEEKDRVKHLGTFDIAIKIKGAKHVVRRTITVKAPEKASYP